MEQVFGMVNELLRKNAETRKRKLNIRTYKVLHAQEMLIYHVSSIKNLLPPISPQSETPKT